MKVVCISCSIVGCTDHVLAFGLLIKYAEDPQERLLAFKAGDKKTNAITIMAKQLAKINFRTSSVSHLCGWEDRV